MAEHLRLVKGDAPPAAGAGTRRRDAGGFVETAAARDILRSLHMASLPSGTGMTMIAGAPGVGKTAAVRRFIQEDPDRARHVTAVRGEGGIYPVADLVLSLWGDGTRNRSRTDVRRDILARLEWEPFFVVVDEAQHLAPDALEWLRAIREEARTPVAFVGDLALERAVRAIPQLWSRMARPVILRAPSREDVAELARPAGLDEPRILRALEGVARRAGGLRNVRAVLDLAGLFAGDGPVEPCHVRAAITDMKLDAKGVRA